MFFLYSLLFRVTDTECSVTSCWAKQLDVGRAAETSIARYDSDYLLQRYGLQVNNIIFKGIPTVYLP